MHINYSHTPDSQEYASMRKICVPPLQGMSMHGYWSRSINASKCREHIVHHHRNLPLFKAWIMQDLFLIIRDTLYPYPCLPSRSLSSASWDLLCSYIYEASHTRWSWKHNSDLGNRRHNSDLGNRRHQGQSRVVRNYQAVGQGLIQPKTSTQLKH